MKKFQVSDFGNKYYYLDLNTFVGKFLKDKMEAWEEEHGQYVKVPQKLFKVWVKEYTNIILHR